MYKRYLKQVENAKTCDELNCIIRELINENNDDCINYDESFSDIININYEIVKFEVDKKVKKNGWEDEVNKYVT